MEQAAENPTVEHTHKGHYSYEARWFSPEALRKIDTELRKGAFDDITWELRDERGEHRSASIDALIAQVPWTNVTRFDASAFRRIRVATDDDDYILKSSHVTIGRLGYVAWSADEGTDIDGARLAFERVRAIIDALPRASGHQSKFGTPPPQPPSLLQRLRPPQSVVEWSIVLGVPIGVTAIIVAVLLAR